MKKQSLISQKRKGPAPTGKGIPILVRIQPDKLAALDDYIAKQPDEPSRPEAIRRVLAEALPTRKAISVSPEITKLLAPRRIQRASKAKR
jgi:hypothetical protein